MFHGQQVCKKENIKARSRKRHRNVKSTQIGNSSSMTEKETGTEEELLEKLSKSEELLKKISKCLEDPDKRIEPDNEKKQQNNIETKNEKKQQNNIETNKEKKQQKNI